MGLAPKVWTWLIDAPTISLRVMAQSQGPERPMYNKAFFFFYFSFTWENYSSLRGVGANMNGKSLGPLKSSSSSSIASSNVAIAVAGSSSGPTQIFHPCSLCQNSKWTSPFAERFYRLCHMPSGHNNRMGSRPGTWVKFCHHPEPTRSARKDWIVGPRFDTHRLLIFPKQAPRRTCNCK